MELTDLVLKRYSVRRIGNQMIAIEDPRGRYKADSPENVVRALSDRRSPDCVDVLMGQTWHAIRR